MSADGDDGRKAFFQREIRTYCSDRDISWRQSGRSERFRFGESSGGSESAEHSRTRYSVDVDNNLGKMKGGGEGGKRR